MEINEIEIWPLLAGLGLFLFGMFMLEDALKGLIGRSFKKFLRKHTNNPIKAVISGMTVTAVLQSSSMVSLLVMSFAGAGIIGLHNGIGLILGANLGTTATGWLVTMVGFKMNIGQIILPFLAIGGLGTIFLKSDRLSGIAKFLMGFSLLFLGLSYMKDGFDAFALHFDFSFLHNKHPLWFVLFGLLLTAAIQSSSAGMLIFLSSLSSGIISLEHAFYLVVGGDLGTTVTAIIGTINGNSIKKKVGWSQFSFNVFNAIVALSLMYFYSYFLLDVLRIKDPLVALVAFHSLINLTGIVILLPFISLFTRLINTFITSSSTKKAAFLEMADPTESHAALEALRSESLHFISMAIDLNRSFFRIRSQRSFPSPLEAYFNLKEYEVEVADFHSSMLQGKLGEEEVHASGQLMICVRNSTLSCKDLKDIKHNLDEIRASATDEYFKLYKHIRKNQQQFYKDISFLLSRLAQLSEIDVEQVNVAHQKFYSEETKRLFQLHAAALPSEMDLPTLQNMLREVNNSNESLLRALSALI